MAQCVTHLLMFKFYLFYYVLCSFIITKVGVKPPDYSIQIVGWCHQDALQVPASAVFIELMPTCSYPRKQKLGAFLEQMVASAPDSSGLAPATGCQSTGHQY